MIRSSTPRRLARLAVRTIGALAATIAVTTAVVPSPARADTTIVYDGAGDAAAHISLIGDSTLSGVRWYDSYGDLRDYNFVFDAESCRRTIEESCWSREGYRPENVISAMQRLSGELGDVLVLMTGYNDSSWGFDEAVDAVVAEARHQGIAHVVWMTFRTSDVSYEEPLHNANVNTYRDSNRVLYDKAAQSGGYLQIADWATFAADRSEWFEYDGVHLTLEGTRGVTTYVATTARRVLAGERVTPATPPWATLAEGDWGQLVTEAQTALAAAGYPDGGIDGEFGEQTEGAVQRFQRDSGLAVSGEVDEPTAVALGVHGAPPTVPVDVGNDRVAARPAIGGAVPAGGGAAPSAQAGAGDDVVPAGEAGAADPLATAGERSSPGLDGGLASGAIAAAGVSAVLALGVRRRRRQQAPVQDVIERMPSAALGRRFPRPVLYDREREDARLLGDA